MIYTSNVRDADIDKIIIEDVLATTTVQHEAEEV